MKVYTLLSACGGGTGRQRFAGRDHQWKRRLASRGRRRPCRLLRPQYLEDGRRKPDGPGQRQAVGAPGRCHQPLRRQRNNGDGQFGRFQRLMFFERAFSGSSRKGAPNVCFT